MSRAHTNRSHGGTTNMTAHKDIGLYRYHDSYGIHPKKQINYQDVPNKFGYGERKYNYDRVNFVVAPSFKRRKFSASTWESCGRPYVQPAFLNSESSAYFNSSVLPASRASDANGCSSTLCKRDRAKFEDGPPKFEDGHPKFEDCNDEGFMSRNEIERRSPSRRDGIDIARETHLRYSYCTFLQNLGIRLDLPQTTIGTAIVLCHRFFVRRSHACHDRFLIATAALFLATKSEETQRPLNNVLNASFEISQKQNLTYLSHFLPVDWFEQYRERVIEAEHILLTTLNFELSVQHPYATLTSILEKLGLSQSILLNVALGLVSEGIYRGLACSAV